ncbi:WD repeat-containing protein mio [Trichoplax sp. H2]|nr:WD repeat-containing protein mio [Trichoplax sp. H2]|eukprot:RDD42772.1 WD repeat-containing protein mio [Trichoplax sp. H2]
MTSVSSQHTGINYSVLWSCNHQDKFISTGSEFCIYTVLSRSDADSEYVDKSKLIALNNGMYAYALESFPCSGTVKSVSWRPSQGRNDDFVFALAISNKNTNKAVITRFVQNGSQRYFHTIADNHLNNKSYHNLEWHPLRPNYLATTMTKFRQDASIIIRDLNISPDCSPLDKFRSNADTFKGIIFDCANGEFVDSFCWLPKFQNGDKNFIAGIGSKMKLFDIKENPRTPTIISSKATNGIVADPFSSNYVMGYNDSTIEIVDLRKTTSAISCYISFLIQKSQYYYNHIIKEFSLILCTFVLGMLVRRFQVFSGVLPVFLKDSSVVKVHDLCSSWEEMKSKSVNILEKGVHYDTYEKTTQLSSIASASFCRHAEFNSYLLAIDNKGYLKSVDINRLIPMSWSPNNEFICDNIEKKKPKGAAYLNFVSSDIATKMNNRACKDYGLFESLIDVENICDERDLKTFWSWIKHIFKHD